MPECVGLYDPEPGTFAGSGEHPPCADGRPRLAGGRAVQLDQQHPVPGFPRVLARHVLFSDRRNR
jgi:hypothetical protein